MSDEIATWQLQCLKMVDLAMRKGKTSYMHNSGKKAFKRNLQVENPSSVAKTWLASSICHMSYAGDRMVTDRQTNRQTDYSNSRTHARRALLVEYKRLTEDA